MLIDAAHTAVLALHFERDIIEPSGALGGASAPMIERDQVLENTARVLTAARERGIPVIYGRVAFDPGHPGLEPDTPLHELVLSSGALVKGTPGTAIVDAVAPAPGEVVVDHVGTSAFVGGELTRVLADRGITTVVVTGVSTDVIVEGTARDAGNAGLRTYVLRDCTAAPDDTSHEAALATLAFVIAGVGTSADFLASLQAEVA